MRLMIVEDEDRTRNGLKKLIRNIDENCRIVGTAKNGREGKKLIEELRPDVVITDIKMPYVNGIEMIEHFKQKESDCIFVLLTGHADFEYAQKAIKLHVSDYLLKPLTKGDVKNLLDQLRGQLEERSAREENRVPAPEAEEEIFCGSSKPVQYVTERIRKNYKDYVCLEILAEELHLTPEYLSTLLHKELGRTFSSYLKKVRIEKAKELLTGGTLLVSEVAEAVGYANSRYFAKVFKEETGMTATEYYQVK